MAIKTIHLAYEGYWREPNFGGIPEYSGVYTFMECTFDKETNLVTLHRILYIGQADNVRERVSKHNKLDVMRRSLAYGNQLCIHCAPIVGEDKSRAEAALVYKHKPPFNDQLKNRFDYPTTAISNSGLYEKLVQRFTVFGTEGYRGYM